MGFVANKIQYAVTHVLFDWDGTLLNSYEADVRAYLTMFAAMGVAWTEAEIAKNTTRRTGIASTGRRGYRGVIGRKRIRFGRRLMRARIRRSCREHDR